MNSDALTRLPKVELHCHLEGTVSPELARELGAGHGLDLSPIIGANGAYDFKDFAEFLVVYDRVSETIRTPEDYYRVFYDYYRGAAAEGLIYGEMFISSDHPARVGISYPTYLDALARAIDDVERDFGVVTRLVLTAVRHWGVDGAEATARLAQMHPHPKVVGFGLAGDETYLSAKDFARAYAMAADAGLKLTAHAGELAGPESVMGALRDLKVQRIGHGVRAIEDESVVAALCDSDVTLEVCPSSNVMLRLYPDVVGHPVQDLTARGVKTSLGSDDPPFIISTIGDEYQRVQGAHGLSLRDMAGFTSRGIGAAFCTDRERDVLRGRLSAWLATVEV